MTQIEAAIAKCDGLIASLKAHIENSEQNNNFKLQLENAAAKENEKLESVAIYAKVFKKLGTLALDKAAAYRDSRKAELEQTATQILSVVFPEEQFVVRIGMQNLYNKLRAEVRIGHMQGEKFVGYAVKCCSGGMNKQLISQALLSNIAVMLHTPSLWCDEVFSHGDDAHVKAAQALLQYTIDHGIQLVMIEHKPSLYEGMTYNRIEIEKQYSDFSAEIKSNEICEAAQADDISKIGTDAKPLEDI